MNHAVNRFLGQYRPIHSVVAFILMAVFSGAASATAVGTMAGQFSVAPSGAATYQMPLTVIPGPGGVEPQLSIGYSSQGGNGLLGMGFSLGGLGAISRCPATFDQDGRSDPVDFNELDKFCMNGQRLVAINGAYGAVGTEYRTELESFSKIVSHGGSNLDPGYFTVQTKDGLIQTFGGTADSRVEAPGRTEAITWAVSRVADTTGAHFDVDYSENHAIGEHLPQQIRYGAGLSVFFDYESRPDRSSGYVGGALVASISRMKRILTRSNGSVVRSYVFEYLPNNRAETPSFLSRVTECAKDGGSEECLPPTEFDWSTLNPGNSLAIALASGICGDGDTSSTGICNDPDNHQYIYYPDFNGDGITDVCYRGDVGITCHDGNTIGQFNAPVIATTICGNQPGLGGTCNDTDNWRTIGFVDFDSDGMSDLVYRSDEGIRVWRSTGTSFESYLNTTICENDSNAYGSCDGDNNYGTIQYPDINADGLADICFRSDSGVYCVKNTGNGLGATVGSTICKDHSDCDEQGVVLTDLTGDGQADVLMRDKTGIHIFKTNSGGANFSHAFSYAACTDMGRCDMLKSLPDLNGDGLQDICYRDKEGIACLANTGKSLVPYFQTDICADGSSKYGTCNDPNNHEVIAFTDFDGDGRSDLVFRSDKGVRVMRTLVFGGFEDFYVTTICADGSSSFGGCDGDNNTRTLGYPDMDGDGVPEIVFRSDSGVRAYSTGIKRWGFLERITNGLGARINIDYAPLTDPAVYSKGSGAVFPIVDTVGANYAVRNVQRSHGLGGLRSQSYEYEGMRVSLRGRGALGFSRMTVVDDLTGLREITDFRQDFPFIGSIAAHQVQLADGRVVSNRVSEYASVALAGVGAATHFVYVSEQTDNSWQTSGTNQIVASTLNEFVYGEPKNRGLFFGNVTHHRVVTTPVSPAGPSFESTTDSLYDNFPGAWHLGRLRQTTVRKSAPNKPTLSRRSTFAYDPVTGLLSEETIDPNGINLKKVYQRNTLGNIERVTTSGNGVTSRTSETRFDASGRFKEQSINALGHTVTRLFNGNTGRMTQQTSTNGIVTTFTQDAFGRPLSQQTQNNGLNRSSGIQREWCGVSLTCRANEVFYTRSFDSSGAESFEFFDVLERSVRQRQKMGDGRYIETRTQYNQRGEVDQRSAPYIEGHGIHWTAYEYDERGRAIVETVPTTHGLMRTTQTTYAGLTTEQNVDGQTLTRTLDVQGRVVLVVDSLGGQVTSEYDAFGNLVQTIDADGNVTTMEYDSNGRKIAMTAPNTHRRTYQYNAYGELIVDASGSMEYDALGRMTRRNDSDGTTSWTYDTLKKGKLTSVSGSGFVKSYRYNSFAAVEAESTSIAEVVPQPIGTPTIRTLSNGETAAGISGSAGTALYFRLDVPSGAEDIEFFISGGGGDADIFVKEDGLPTVDDYDCRSISDTNEDSCSFNQRPGTWYMMVRGYTSFYDLSVRARYSHPGNPYHFGRGQSQTGIANWDSRGWSYDVEFETPLTRFEVTTSGGIGDSDLRVFLKNPNGTLDPVLGQSNCYDDGPGNSASCSGVTPLGTTPFVTSGEYRIQIMGQTEFYDAQLIATYSVANSNDVFFAAIEPVQEEYDAAEQAVEDGQVAADQAREDIEAIADAVMEIYQQYRDQVPPPEEVIDDVEEVRDIVIQLIYEVRDIVLGILNDAPPPADVIQDIEDVIEYYSGILPPEFVVELVIGLTQAYLEAVLTLTGQVLEFVQEEAVDFLVDYVGGIRDQLPTYDLNDTIEEVRDDIRATLAAVGEIVVDLVEDALDRIEVNGGRSSAPTRPPSTPDNPLKTFGTGLVGPASSQSAAGMRVSEMRYFYDNQGRVTVIDYPTLLYVRNNYNIHGALESVSNDVSGLVYWQATEYDHTGQASRARLGNGLMKVTDRDVRSGAVTKLYGTGPAGVAQHLTYEWDSFGNLGRRDDKKQSVYETFTYDSLNRLTGTEIFGVDGVPGGTQLLSMGYSPGGNILTKSGVSYEYADQPQAVSHAQGVDYQYDAHGNMTRAGNRTMQWSSYDALRTIHEGGTQTSFLYGPSRERLRQVSQSDVRGSRVSYFFHKLYEEEVRPQGISTRAYINTPDGVSTILTGGAQSSTEYLQRDHLGSIDTITNQNGTVMQKMSFNAFGQRRGSQWQPKEIQDYVTNWGYTGHQQQDDFGLIHMGGRVYDPILGRFLSPDPFVQAPSNSQSHNRYSYVLNNPLVYTDPSGFIVNRIGREFRRWERDFRHELRREDSLLGPILRAYGAIAAGGCGPAAPVCNAGIQAGISRAQGASSWEAIRGGAIAGATYFAAGYVGPAFSPGQAITTDTVLRVIAHGVIDGTASVLNGGSFGRPFLRGTFTSAGGYYFGENPDANILVAAIIGGTAAEIGGGKFANGAVTGAFAYALSPRLGPDEGKPRRHSDIGSAQDARAWLEAQFPELPSDFKLRPWNLLERIQYAFKDTGGLAYYDTRTLALRHDVFSGNASTLNIIAHEVLHLYVPDQLGSHAAYLAANRASSGGLHMWIENTAIDIHLYHQVFDSPRPSLTIPSAYRR